MPANTHIVVYSCLWIFPGWLGSDKSSTSAPRCRKCEPGAGEGELSEHAAYTACPKPVDYAHQTTHYFEHHVFYPPSGEWVGRSKAPLPIDISGFSKNQIESGAFRLCARTPYTSVPILQHHIIMMHVTSRMLIQLPGTGIFLPDAIMSRWRRPKHWHRQGRRHVCSSSQATGVVIAH